MREAVVVRPIKDQEEFFDIVRLVDAANFLAYYPTHAITKGGKLAGYFGGWGGPPPLFSFFDPQSMTARDSISAIRQMENHARNLGMKHGTVLCDSNSPFFPLMPRLGYKNISANTNIFDISLCAEAQAEQKP